MVSDNNEPADLAGFRPDYGREIPPRLNPDVPVMVDQVKCCYVELTQWIVGFQDEIVALVDAGKVDPGAHSELLEHYRSLQEAVDAAAADALTWHPGAELETVHRLADHAKYVYAIGARDIAALQYRLSELAGTGLLDPEVHKRLQWNHCQPMWEALHFGTLCAVHDERTWDGGWDWSDNTYSDGRQVMAKVRIKNWQKLNRGWPYNEGICGDGPINEHPRGSLCQIAPVTDPQDGYLQHHPAIEIDLDELIKQLGPTTHRDFVVDIDAESTPNAAILGASE